MITYAQEITVTGKVTAGGEEMPGVTVAVKGQTRGNITSITTRQHTIPAYCRATEK